MLGEGFVGEQVAVHLLAGRPAQPAQLLPAADQTRKQLFEIGEGYHAVGNRPLYLVGVQLVAGGVLDVIQLLRFRVGQPHPLESTRHERPVGLPGKLPKLGYIAPERGPLTRRRYYLLTIHVQA